MTGALFIGPLPEKAPSLRLRGGVTGDHTIEFCYLCGSTGSDVPVCGMCLIQHWPEVPQLFRRAWLSDDFLEASKEARDLWLIGKKWRK